MNARTRGVVGVNASRAGTIVTTFAILALAIGLVAACSDTIPPDGGGSCTLGTKCEAETQGRLYVSLPPGAALVAGLDAGASDSTANDGGESVLLSADVSFDGKTYGPTASGDTFERLPCTGTWFGYNGLTTMHLRVLRGSTVLGEEDVGLAAFNTCGHDAVYISVSLDSSGKAVFAAPRLISVCEEIL
jgi:hypothetical protein